MKAALTFLVLALIAFPVRAQDTMAPPKPIEDPLWNSLIGDWEGWTEFPNGKSIDKVEFEWELHKQFFKTQVESKQGEMEFKLTGYTTIDPKTGAMWGYWFDSFRMVYKSTQTQQGNKVTIKWEGGPAPFERSFEKVGDDKLVGTFKDVDVATGKPVEGKWELTRKQKKSKM
jgi:hypothetical protein